MNEYKIYHDNLTRAYYNNKIFNGQILTQGVFEALHTLNHLKREKDYPDPIDPLVDIDNRITIAENALPSGLTYSVTQCEVGE